MKKLICSLMLVIILISFISCNSIEPTIQYIEKEVMVKQCCGNEGVEYAPIDNINVAIICKTCGRELGELPMAKTIVEKEIIKEIPVEVIIEKEIIVEREVIVEKEISVNDFWIPCAYIFLNIENIQLRLDSFVILYYYYNGEKIEMKYSDYFIRSMADVNKYLHPKCAGVMNLYDVSNVYVEITNYYYNPITNEVKKENVSLTCKNDRDLWGPTFKFAEWSPIYDIKDYTSNAITITYKELKN